MPKALATLPSRRRHFESYETVSGRRVNGFSFFCPYVIHRSYVRTSAYRIARLSRLKITIAAKSPTLRPFTYPLKTKYNSGNKRAPLDIVLYGDKDQKIIFHRSPYIIRRSVRTDVEVDFVPQTPFDVPRSSRPVAAVRPKVSRNRRFPKIAFSSPKFPDFPVTVPGARKNVEVDDDRVGSAGAGGDGRGGRPVARLLSEFAALQQSVRYGLQASEIGQRTLQAVVPRHQSGQLRFSGQNTVSGGTAVPVLVRKFLPPVLRNVRAIARQRE